MQTFILRLLLVALCFAAILPAQSGKPNIIYIMADDMGIADAGAYGGTLIQTPNIDRLAREGTRFTQVYSGHGVCAPSRNALMTGLHTGHTTVRGNFGKKGVVGIAGGEYRVPIPDNTVTVAEVLKRAGYVTAITGKWGLGEPNTAGIPNRQGFDHWFGYLNQRRAHTYYPTFLWLNEEKFDLPGNEAEPRTQYAHDLFTGFALNFVRRYSDEPFFLYLPYTTPHGGYLKEEGGYEIPDLGAYADKSWKDEEKVYAAMITRMDEHIGRLLGLLDDLNIAGNTVVFFCSDNGAVDRSEHLFKSAGPFREKKGSLYEGGTRVPMIVRWPGHVPAGQVNEDAVWYFTDFLPTAADIAGVDPRVSLDGISVLPTLLGRDQNTAGRFLYWEKHERNAIGQAARWRNWKAVRHTMNGPIELYDLAADVGEQNDVAKQNPEVVNKFEEYFRTCRTESEYWPNPES